MSDLYLFSYLLMILIVDFSGVVDTMTPLVNICRKSSMISHLLHCSLCCTFWVTLVFVIAGLNYWWLLLPFGSSVVSGFIGKLYDLFGWVINKL